MSQTTLIEKIKADATAEVAHIKEAGEAEVAAIQRETEAALASKRATHEAAQAKKLAHMELVALAKAKQAGKLAIQRAKRSGIDTLFAEVESTLTALPTVEYVSVFAKHAAEIVPNGVVATVVRAPENRIDETKEILKQQDIVCDITADSSIKAGFVLQTADGVFDVTLARLVGERRQTLEMELLQKVLS